MLSAKVELVYLIGLRQTILKYTGIILKIALSTIILTTTVSYLTQYWFKHSGLEDKILNKLDDFKDTFKVNNDKKN